MNLDRCINLEDLQRAAKRLLRLKRDLRLVVLGHSHEQVTNRHPVNTPYTKEGRAYINPGSWIPCRNMDDEDEPLSMAEMRKVGFFCPYDLNVARILTTVTGRVEGRCETFESGEMWMLA